MVSEPSSGHAPKISHGERGARYIAVGLFNTVFSVVSYGAFLQLLGEESYLLTLVPATVVSVLESFLLQRAFVYMDGDRSWRASLRFFAIAGMMACVNASLLYVGVDLLGLPALPAQILYVGGIAVVTYVVNYLVVFRLRAPDTP